MAAIHKKAVNPVLKRVVYVLQHKRPKNSENNLPVKNAILIFALAVWKNEFFFSVITA